MREIAEFDLHVVPWLRHTAEAVTVWPAQKRATHKPKGPKKKAEPKPLHDGHPDPDKSEDGSEESSSGDSGAGDGSGDEWEEELKALAAALGLGGAGVGSGGGGGGGEPVPPDPVDPVVEVDVDDVGPHGVPPPPDPHPVLRRGRGTGEPKYLHYPVYKDGLEVGYMLINANASQIDAHCTLHGSTCRVGRSFLAAPEEAGVNPTPMRLAKGRPLGFLVAWLFLGTRWEGGAADRDLHFGASKCSGEWNFLKSGACRERQEGRAYAQHAPELAPCREKERPPRAGEGLEPVGKI